MTRTHTRIGRIGWAAALTSCLLTQSSPPAAAQGQLVLKVATSAHAASPWGRALARFSDYVQQRGQGRIRVRVFHEGALGTDEHAIERVIEGSLQAYAGPIEALYPTVKSVRAIAAPYLFGSQRVANRALTRATHSVTSQLNAAGLQFGTWQSHGFRSWFSTTGPIHNRDDLTGATEATIVGAAQRGLHLRARHVTLTRHAYAAGILVYSKRWFDGLPAQTQEFLNELPPEIATPIVDELEGMETQLLDGMRARGVEIHIPDASEGRTLSRSSQAALDAFVRTLSEPGRVLYRKLRGER